MSPRTTQTVFLRVGARHVVETHVHVAAQHAGWAASNDVFRTLCVPVIRARLRSRLRVASTTANTSVATGNAAAAGADQGAADIFRDAGRGFQVAYFFHSTTNRRAALSAVNGRPYQALIVIPRTLVVVVEPFNPLAPMGSALATQSVPDFLNLRYRAGATIDHYFLPTVADDNTTTTTTTTTRPNDSQHNTVSNA